MDTDPIVARGACAVGSRPFRYLGWVALGVAVGAALIAAAALFSSSKALARENGPLEMLSVAFWGIAGLMGLALVFRVSGSHSRIAAFWTAWIACLAALREIDAHILLNPQHIGSLGVRYRMDWWANAGVSPWLKLGWALAFVIAFAPAAVPPVLLARRMLTLWRRGDAMVGVLAVAVVFLAMGFVIDDILRPVRMVSRDAKMLIEESSELIGACLYLAATVLQWRRPLGPRLADAGLLN